MRRQNCVFHTESGLCIHLDMGRGPLWMMKRCVLYDNFVGSCTKRVGHSMLRPGTEPPPTRKLR